MRKCWQVLKTCQGPDSARPWHAQLRILVFIQKNGTKLRMGFKYQGDMIIPAFWKYPSISCTLWKTNWSEGPKWSGGGCRWIRRLEKDPWWEMLLAWTKEVVVKTDWKVQREFAMVENDRGTESDLELYNIKHRKYSDTSIWRNKHWKMAISRYGRDLNYSTYRLVILFRYLKYRYSALWVWNPEERSGMKICILKS